MLNADAREALTNLVQRYHGSLGAKLKDLQAAFDAAKASGWAEDSVRQLRLLAHRLAGSAASYGFNELGAAASEMDQVLLAVHEGNLPNKDQALPSCFDGLSEALTGAIARPPPGDPSVQAESGRRPGADLPAVFLVDDDHATVDILSRQLMSRGFSVHGFTDPNKALECVEQLKPSAILMDIGFAEGEEYGFQVAEAIVSRLRYKPGMVYLSARSDVEARQWAVDSGADAFFSKPVNIPAMAQLLELFGAGGQVSPGRVAVIEDDVQIGQFYVNMLEAADFQVLMIPKSGEALEQVLEFRPELILMDMQMPELDGISLTAIMRQHESLFDIPVLFLTSVTDPNMHRQAIRAGGDALLQKSDDPELVLTVIRNRITRFKRVTSSLTLDPLTRVVNRPTLMERLNLELQRAQRDGQAFSLVVVDIDNFGQLNDEHGRMVGDAVLRTVTDIIRARLRKVDLIGRYGGDEIMMMMPSTKRASAEAVVREIVAKAAETVIEIGEQPINFSVSAGIVESRLDRHDSAHFAVHQLLSSVDKQMTAARSSGCGTVLSSVEWLAREAEKD